MYSDLGDQTGYKIQRQLVTTSLNSVAAVFSGFQLSHGAARHRDQLAAMAQFHIAELVVRNAYQ